MSRLRLMALLLLGVLLWFGPLQRPHLFDPDEGRYAEVPREMAASGNWVTPRLDGIKYFEKPPLQYWMTAATYGVVGQNAWAVRFWPALTGFLGLLATLLTGRRLFGARAGVLAALVQAGALLYLAMARVATLDMGLTFALQLALCGLVLLVTPAGTAAPPDRRWALLLALGVSLAVLSKGLVGILIPGSVCVIYMLWMRDARLLWQSRPWYTLLGLGVLAAPWFVLVSRANPEFAHFFFIFQHFQRFLSTTGFDRYQPPWFFLPILAAGFLPWTALLPSLVRDAWRRARSREPATVMLLAWALFVLVFFSASQSKLVPYILPMFPALSLLAGRTLDEMPVRHLATHLWAASVLFLVLALVCGGLMVSGRLHLPSDALLGFSLAFFLWGLGLVAGGTLADRGSKVAAVLAATLGTLAMVETGLQGADRLPKMREVSALGPAVASALGPQTSVYCVKDYVQPLPFAIRRPCTLVGYRGELDFGLLQQPQLAIADVEHFLPVWQAQRDAVAILHPEDWRALQALGAPMRLIYSGSSYVVVARS